MVVDTGTAILILGAFVLPGFITLILRERLYVVGSHETPFERLLSALLYSAVIYGVLLVTAHQLGLQKEDLVEFHDGEKSLGEDLLAASAVLLLPALIAVAGSWWTASRTLRPWILRLAGYSEPFPDLYLSQRWDLDDDRWSLAPRPDRSASGFRVEASPQWRSTTPELWKEKSRKSKARIS